MKTKLKIPFSINRGDKRTLVAQVIDGLRFAIVGGFYRAGDLLPGSRELAEDLGISRIVTLAALRTLTAEGYIEARPRIGSMVRDRGEKSWRGRVLLVCPDGDDCFFQNIFAGALRDRLTDAGYLFSEVVVKTDVRGKYDFTRLDAALSMRADLVVVMYAREEIFNYLARRKTPFAVFGEVTKPPRGAVGSVLLDYDGAVDAFVDACKAKRIKKVTVVYWHTLMCNPIPALERACIQARAVNASPEFPDGRVVGVQRAGLDLMTRLLADRHLHRDELYFFADDFLTVGALAALSYHGCKAPEDLKLATWANRELGPIYPRRLSRMEMDEVAAGNIAASSVIEYLLSGAFPRGVSVKPVWHQGETM